MSDDAALVVTLKAGTGYDAPWIVVRGENPDEVTNKLNGLGDVIGATIAAAELFKGAGNAGPLLPQAPVQQPQEAPAAPAQGGWGQAPQQQYQQPQAPAPQQQQQSKFGGPPHPEGKQCESPGCGKVLEMKKTSTGKGTWRCPDWRWNSGVPNGHSSEWM